MCTHYLRLLILIHPQRFAWSSGFWLFGSKGESLSQQLALIARGHAYPVWKSLGEGGRNTFFLWKRTGLDSRLRISAQLSSLRGGPWATRFRKHLVLFQWSETFPASRKYLCLIVQPWAWEVRTWCPGLGGWLRPSNFQNQKWPPSSTVLTVGYIIFG